MAGSTVRAIPGGLRAKAQRPARDAYLLGMYVIMGATGHVGGAVTRALREAGADVRIVTRDARKAARFAGAHAVEVDVHDVAALRGAFQGARRAFLLNPPAPPSSDTDREERATAEAIVAALDGSGLEAVVAASTYGAQPGERIGDLSVLYGFEQALRRQTIPCTIVRGAYYYSNFDALLEPARARGELPTMIPGSLRLPMVAPEDIGRVAARLLQDPAPGALVHVEGPERLTFADVARAFGRALARDVAVVEIPRDAWVHAFRELGFSAAAAQAFANMMAATVDGRAPYPRDPVRGPTTLQAYIDALVRAGATRTH